MRGRHSIDREIVLVRRSDEVVVSGWAILILWISCRCLAVIWLLLG